MPKSESKKPKTLAYDDDALNAARLAGRNDLLPDNAHIPGPYTRNADSLTADADDDDVEAAIKSAAGEAGGEGAATGDDRNTASAGGTRGGTSRTQ